MMTKERFERWADRLARWFSATPHAAILVAPAVLTIFVVMYGHGAADLDVFARVAVGRLIHRDGAVPQEDPFAFTPTLAIWFDHEWLSGLVFYAISQRGGDLGLFTFSFACAVAAMALLWCAQRQVNTERDFAAVCLAYCAVPLAFGWLAVVRSHVFTILGLSYSFWACIRYRTHGDARLLWGLPVLMVWWANAHGGFVAGLGVLGLTTVGLMLDPTWSRQAARPRGSGEPCSTSWWRPAACLAACLLVAAVANPYGPRYLKFIWSAVTKNRDLVTEWGPLPLVSSTGVMLLPALVVLGWGLLKAPHRVPVEGRALLLMTLALGLRHFRHMVLFFLTVAAYGMPYAVEGLKEVRRLQPIRYAAIRRSLVLVAMAGVVVALVAVADLARRGPAFRLRSDHLPVQAMEWLRRHRDGGRLVTHFNEGSYALWRGYPRFTIGIDGRYEEVYPDQTVDLVHTALDVGDPAHEQALQALAPDYLLVCLKTAPQAFRRGFGDRWPLIYADDRCRVYAHTPNLDGDVGRPSGVLPDMWHPDF